MERACVETWRAQSRASMVKAGAVKQGVENIFLKIFLVKI